MLSELNKLRLLSSVQYEMDLQTMWRDITNNKYEEHFIEELYFRKAIALPSFIYPIESDDFNQLEFFRARSIDSKREDISLISTFSYPPSDFCEDNGRANIANKPVFYCTDHPVTAIYELRPAVGATVYLSIWKSVIDRAIKVSPLISMEMPESNHWYFLAKEMSEHFNDKITTEDLLIKFLCKVFKEETKPYSLSSWIANYLIYKNDKIDGILYESIAGKFLQSNFAFHPNIADQYLRIDRIYKMENIAWSGLEKRYYNPQKIPNQIGELCGKVIIWRDFKESDLDKYPFSTTKFKK